MWMHVLKWIISAIYFQRLIGRYIWIHRAVLTAFGLSNRNVFLLWGGIGHYCPTLEGWTVFASSESNFLKFVRFDGHIFFFNLVIFIPDLVLFSFPTVAHEHLKERGIFGIAPPPPGVNPADYYHQMTLLASHPSPYGELLLQGGAVGAGGHLHDYLTPMDGKWLPNELYFWLFALFRSVKPNLRNVFEAILLVSSEHRCPQTWSIGITDQPLKKCNISEIIFSLKFKLWARSFHLNKP